MNFSTNILAALVCFGLASATQSKIVDVSVSDSFHTCVTFDSGKGKCWGSNLYGKLGIGSGQNYWGADLGDMATLPFVQVADKDNKFIKKIVGSYDSTCALFTSGRVKCWGNNREQVLGFPTLGTYVGRRLQDMGMNLPTIPLGTDAPEIIDIAANYMRRCALFVDGRVKCWGGNNQGLLGIESADQKPIDTPEKMAALPYTDLGANFKAVEISLGQSHSCARSNLGKVKCWGYNGNGELGLGSPFSKGSVPGEMGAALRTVDLGADIVTRVQAAASATCVLLSTGKVKCWGSNPNSSLIGIGGAIYGTTRGSMGGTLPVVDLGPDYVAKDLVCHGNVESQCCAVLITNIGDGVTREQLKCWGGNTNAVLGLGDTKPRGQSIEEMGEDLHAVELGTGVAPISQVAVSNANTCVLFSDSRLKCWGTKSSGALTEQMPPDDENPLVGDSPDEMGDGLQYLEIKE